MSSAEHPPAGPLFKIVDGGAWALPESRRLVPWAEIDRADGFLHLSAAHQVRETAAKHFAGRQGLVLLQIDAHDLDNLRWEPSRGGDLFPHVYGDIPSSAVLRAVPLPWTNDGFVFDPDVPC